LDTEETLIINNLRLNKKVLSVQPIRRCNITSCYGICCSCGVWLDNEEKANILRHADLVKPHLPAERQDPQLWFGDYDEEDDSFPSGHCGATDTFPDPDHPYGEVCIFLRPDARCALQVTALANEMHSWALKPFFCALYPLVIDEGWLEIDDENELYLEEACCKHLVHVEEPLYVVMKDEFVHALGEEGYQELCRWANGQASKT